MNEFKSKLGDLLVNKKCIIHELTDLAKAYEDNAEVIVSEIQSHIAEVIFNQAILMTLRYVLYSLFLWLPIKLL